MSKPHNPIRDMNNDKLLVAPAWLGQNASLIFSRLAKEIQSMRVATNVDAEALALLADNMSDYQLAVADVEENGLWSVGDKGQRVRSQSVVIKNTAFKNIQGLLPVFGMTPSSRAQLGIGNTTEEDPVQAFLQNPNRAPSK